MYQQYIFTLLWLFLKWGSFVFQGLEYLTKNGLINETPEDIAKFLYKNDGLNKIKIGEYLGEKYNFY